MRHYITQNELNKLILEELKKVQEGKTEVAAGLARVVAAAGEQAGEIYSKNIRRLPSAYSDEATVKRYADEAIEAAEKAGTAVAKGDVMKPGSLDRLKSLGSGLAQKVKDNPRAATAAATTALVGVGATASLAGGGGAPEDAPGGGGGGGAPSGGGTSSGQPVPGQPGSLPSTGGSASTGDRAWDKYLRGSEYVTADQAKEVYDAWVAFVNSQGMKEQTGGVDKSFASYREWWKTNKTKGNLGQHGDYADTIAHLKSQTKQPEAAPEAPVVDREPEAAPAGRCPRAILLIVTSSIAPSRISLPTRMD